ncbi:hypothetical protein [Acidovorax sp. LjRoot117]
MSTPAACMSTRMTPDAMQSITNQRAHIVRRGRRARSPIHPTRI